MEITLEKIELVKDRTGVSYKDAKAALEAADGSVVDAIINIEEEIDAKCKTKFGENSHVIEKVKELVKKGNVSKIVIKKEDDVILNLPVNIGILGTVIAPIPVVLGTLAAFGTKCVIEVIKEDGSIIDVSEMANDTISDVIEKGSVVADEVKVKGAEVYQNVVEKANDAISKAKREDDNCCCGCDDDSCEECEDDCGCCCDDREEK